MESSSGQGITILVMGLASCILPIFGLICGPAFILGPLLSLASIGMTVGLFGRVSRGEVQGDGKIFAIIGAVLGALGLLEFVGFFISVFGLVFISVLFAG